MKTTIVATIFQLLAVSLIVALPVAMVFLFRQYDFSGGERALIVLPAVFAEIYLIIMAVVMTFSDYWKN